MMKNTAPKVPPMPSMLVKALKEGQHFASMLNNLCQILRWRTPEYEFTEAEEGFRCEAEVSALNRLVTGISIATKKQRAKNQAVRQILEELQQEAPQNWSEWYRASCQEEKSA